MLSLQMKSGEYLTIGEDIVVQVFTTSTIRVSVQAPKELTILRGEVRERTGEERPPCLSGQQPGRRKNTKTGKSIPNSVSVSNG